MQIDLDSLNEDGNAHERFLDGIRDAATRRKYGSYLSKFLAEMPDNVYGLAAGPAAESDEERARQFVLVARRDQDVARAVIAQYIKMHKKRVEAGRLSPNTLPNLIKPIHALLDSNGVALHWKSLYRMYPRPTKTEDRGYTRREIQTMLV